MSLLFKKKESPLPDLRILLSEYNRSLMLIADKTLLIKNVIATIRQLCPVDAIYVFLLDRNTGKYKTLDTSDKPMAISFSEKDRLVKWLSVNEKELVVSPNPDIVSYLAPEEKAILQQLQTEFVYPLIIMNRISGMVMLGNKTNGQPFTQVDADTLSLFFNQAAFAIEHAMLYEHLTERIKKMYRADRLATLGELAAGAAHEIRNPLTSINSSIQYLSKDYATDTAKSAMIQEILTEVERINKIVQGLLSFARPSVLNQTAVSLEQLINQTLLLIKTNLKKQRIEIQFEYFTDNTTIQGDAEQLKQVFLNILINAIEAMKDNEPDKPRIIIISIEIGAMIDLASRYLIVSFEDTGKGISENDIENVFNPFFTTKEDGTGLGLAICYGIIDRHQGEIEVKSLAGRGAVVQIKLPQK